MPSPFPGMDPYLEDPSIWQGVHQRLITYIGDKLESCLRPKYHARIGERVYVVEPPQQFYPDVFLVKRPVKRQRSAKGISSYAGAAVADSPHLITVTPVEICEPFVEILLHKTGQVVTLIEVLSPTNKAPGDGQDLYQKKQMQTLCSQSNLVEIDLIDRGAHTAAVSESALQELPPWRYLVSVNRNKDRSHFEVYSFSLPDRLPRFRIPLRDPDPDVVLDLPALFNRCYDNGGYGDMIDYRKNPPALFSREESRWVEELLAQEGLRKKKKG